MLVRFRVSNFLSFRKDLEFNMLVDSQKWHTEHVYCYKNLEILKTAALYGANGAGKSNLVKAISFLKKLVTKGDWSSLDLKPFRLDPSCEELNSAFEIEFVKNSKVYLYGISLQNHSIIEESLYETEIGKPDKKLFSRKIVNGKAKVELAWKYINNEQDKIRIEIYQNEFLKEYTPFIKLISDSTESFEEIKTAYSWFKENLLIVFPRTRPAGLAERLHKSEDFKKFAEGLICSFHTGISEIEVTQNDLDQFFGKDDKEFAEQIKKDLVREGSQIIPLRSSGSREELIAVLHDGRPVIKRLISKHANKEGKLFDFLIDEESDGTVRLFDLIPAFYSAISSETTVIIDEIDQSIHPSLLKELVKKFASDNNTKGQLIFTTHESNLLDQDIFRRDEIWFVEKDKNGETTLYPLSDYDIRADLDIRKGYLLGRFGAIPFLANLHDLKWGNYIEHEPSI